MRFSLAAIAASALFTSSVQGQQVVVLSDECNDLVSGDAPIVTIGEVCAVVAADNLEVTMTVKDPDCLIIETHICNLPSTAYSSADGVRTHTYSESIEKVYEFVCNVDTDSYVVAGHVTAECKRESGLVPETAYYEIELGCNPIEPTRATTAATTDAPFEGTTGEPRMNNDGATTTAAATTAAATTTLPPRTRGTIAATREATTVEATLFPLTTPTPPAQNNAAEPDPIKSCKVYPDPHFRTFQGLKYDFHGGCDLVLLQNPGFAGGMGLDMHIRTEVRGRYSTIVDAAVRIGRDTFEGTDKGAYFWNGEESFAGDMSFGGGAYPLTKTTRGYKIDLGNGQTIVITIYRGRIRVQTTGRQSDFATTEGLCGTWDTALLANRAGDELYPSSITGRKYSRDMGLAWQVAPGSDPTLFLDAGVEVCSERVWSKKVVSREKAEELCKDVPRETFEDCIFDVEITGEEDWAEAPWYDVEEQIVVPGTYKPDYKCPHNHGDRLYRLEKQTLDTCKQSCAENENCKYYSFGTEKSSHPGVCMGCTTGDNADPHPGFDLYPIEY